MRERLPAVALFTAASLVNLPVVYHLVAAPDAHPVIALGFGLLAMGHAWAAGFHVQAKRRNLVRVLAVAGILEGAAAAFVGPLGLPEAARPWLYATAGLSAVALVLAERLPRPARD